MTYIPNPNFEEEFLASDQMLKAMGEIVGPAAEIAEALAPKSQEFLADGIEAETGFVDKVATGRLNSHDFKSHWHEFGTRHHPATPFVRPAMEQVTGKPLKGGDK